MEFIGIVFAAFALMLLAVLGLAAGVLAGRKPIAGSCGGIGAVGLEKTCTICGGDTQKCEDASSGSQPAKAADLAYDATK